MCVNIQQGSSLNPAIAQHAPPKNQATGQDHLVGFGNWPQSLDFPSDRQHAVSGQQPHYAIFVFNIGNASAGTRWASKQQGNDDNEGTIK